MSDEHWIRSKSPHVLRNTLTALDRIAGLPCATLMGQPFEGETVFIVGAGPSLAKNGHLLRQAKECGPVVCVNASSAPLESYGVTADILVVRESLDIGAQIAASNATWVAVDISCHPGVWDAAGDRAMWFLPGYPRHFQLAHQLGCRPVFGGTSALCSAVSLSIMWGAREIVLVGVDLAMGRDGATYHSSAPRGTQTVKVEGDRLLMSGNEADEELHRRTGQTPHGTDLEAIWVDAWDGGDPVPTISTHLDQLEWLATVPQRHPGVTLTDCTEGGAAKPGWARQGLRQQLSWTRESIVPGLRDADGASVDRERVARAKADIRRQAELLTQLSDEMLDDPSGLNICLMGGVEMGAPLAECLAAVGILDSRGHAPGAPRARAAYEAYREGAQKTLSITSGQED